MKKSIYTLLVLLFVVSCQKTVDLDNDKEEFINDLISNMTLAEKAGQMNQYNGFWDATGPMPEGDYQKKRYNELKNGQVGSMLNVIGVDEIRALQKIAVEETRLGIPSKKRETHLSIYWIKQEKRMNLIKKLQYLTLLLN